MSMTKMIIIVAVAIIVALFIVFSFATKD